MPASHHVLVVGGTGFIGFHAVMELRRRGHKVKALARSLPPPGVLPADVPFVRVDCTEASDRELSDATAGMDAVIFAAGADDRVVPRAPADAFFRRQNVDPVRRLFAAARETGAKRGVVCGSYFAYFDRVRPKWRLAHGHPYIRFLREQTRAAFEF